MQNTKTQFELDWEQTMNINGMESNKGYYNLVVKIRDLGLWTKLKMKPNRHWKLKDVKTYFGLTGSAQTILDRLIDFKEGNL